MMIFRIVVLPVPLSPMMATCSPFFSSKFRCSNRVREPKDLDRSSTRSTSLPLVNLGSNFRCISARTSVGLSSTSILSSIFTRLSARRMDFSRLKERSFSITSSWCLISCCCFMYAWYSAVRSISFLAA